MGEKPGFQIEEQAPLYYESNVSLFMAPFVVSLVSAAVGKGDTVLDVACGTGFAARAASISVGPSGNVVGSDINPGM
ncbi:MAG: class I SAM-dependent methyltransferase, partial [Alphaproteobacteria bacterium]